MKIPWSGFGTTERWLLAAAVCALIVLAPELLWPHRIDVHGNDDGAPADPHVVAPAERHPVPALLAYREIADRPLFTVDRRRYELPAEKPVEVSSPPAPPTPPPIRFELTGVISTPSARLALLRAERSPEVTKLAVGEGYEGWTLVEVESAAVVLRNGEEVTRLELGADRDIQREAMSNRNGDPAAHRQR